MHNSLVRRSHPQALLRLCTACARVAGVPTSRPYHASRSAAPRPGHSTQSTSAAWMPRSARARYSTTAQAPKPETQPQQQRADSTQTAKPPPSEPDYYALFPQTLPEGPPPAGPFEIDTRALRREFLQLQAAVHPDLHHSAGSGSAGGGGDGGGGSSGHSAERRRAEAASSHVNSAYRTLASPLARARYLLRRRHGLDLEGDEAARLAQPDPVLLAEVMAAREEVDDAADAADLEPLRAANDARVRACERALADAFARDDPAAAVAAAVRLRYWLNVRETIDDWEPGS